jgi:5-methylcytosine-specific restriction endonuclease McrA
MPNLPNRAKRYDKADTREFHSLGEWKRASKAHKAQYPICQRCIFLGIETRESSRRLEVHHITQLEVDWDRRVDADNLLTVCRPCHRNYTLMENTGKREQSIAEGEEVRDYTQTNEGISF